MNRSASRALIVLLAASLCALSLAGAAAADPTAEVIGGTDVTHTQYTTTYPYMLGVLADTNPAHQFCGGTLIAPQWAMTAAHCYAPDEGANPAYVRIGSETRASGGEFIPITAHFIHPNWDPDAIHNDVMLLHLAYAPTPATPAVLANAAQDPAGGNVATLIGWGLTASGTGASSSIILQSAALDIVDQTVCADTWSGIADVFSTQVCAIHYADAFSTDRLACNGDSGGPLIFAGRVIGITSYGVTQCYPWAPNVYTRVSSFTSWISGVMDKTLYPSAASVDFGGADVKTGSVDRSITLRSDGASPITVSGASATGDFVVKSSTCAGSLAPGATCTVNMTFDPGNSGARRGSLILATDSAGYPVVSVPLTGTGTGISTTPVTLKLTLPHRTKTKSGKLNAKFRVAFTVPAGTPSTIACTGLVTLSLKIPKIRKPVHEAGAMAWSPTGCGVNIRTRMSRKARGKKAKATVTFAGNAAVAPATLTTKIKIR